LRTGAPSTAGRCGKRARLRKRMKRTLLALGGVIVVAIAAGGWLWHQHFAAREGGSYQPRELLKGANEPVAPRVAPELEQLDTQGLEDAAAYAAAHGSRALIVSRHDHIVFERYWQGTHFDTLADAQGFTPLLAALATGTAVSHRMIGWPDEPVSAFLAEWSRDPRGAITVRNLMHMASGLAPRTATQPPQDLVAGVLALPLASAPGSVRVEKSADPQLLALVIERATHQRYADYVSQALWRRLGAGDAWLWLDRAGGTTHADCCMLAQQGDWIRVGELLLRDGNYRGSEVIRPGWVTLMRSPSSADADHGSYVRLGAHVPVGHEPYARPDVFVVEGGKGGNRLWVVPSMQIAILCTGSPEGRDAGWEETRVPNLVMHAAHDYLPAAPATDVSSMVPAHKP
jgi:CubicO group peptidase (beta-lactamase class C family)